MDNICFLVGLRTRICQSGVPVISEKTYTNVSSSTNILLENGYTLSISRATNDTINVLFNNTALGFTFNFNVSNNTTNFFDIPIDSGTMRVSIFVLMRCCNCC